jgi:hypothetical protein
MNARANNSVVRSALSVVAVALLAGSAMAAEPVTVIQTVKPEVDSPAPAARYNPDFNHDGKVEIQDLFDYLTAWFAGKPEADVNGNKVLEGLDILEFVNSWLAGPIVAGK